MDLEIEDVAELLSVSETTVRHWIQEGAIPSYRLNRQYRFSRVELEDWVMSRHLEQNTPRKPPEGLTLQRKNQGSRQFSLYRAIHHGGVYDRIPGKARDEVIRNTTALLAPKLNWDADVVADLLIDREKMMPTSLGSGVAIPHTRDFIPSGSNNTVTVVFPEEPIDYGALDGEKVHTLFFLFAADDKSHLHLLAKIAYLSHQPALIQELSKKPSKDRLLDLVKAVESEMAL